VKQQASRWKTFSFYTVTIALSLIASLALIELILLNLTYTNSVDLGSDAQKRWYIKHWKPFNELILRDFPLSDRLELGLPKLYFLGDSFTAGAGVEFKETYYYQAAWQPSTGYNPFNLARPGSSTRDQLKEIESFDERTGSSASIVVHQYFVNDIADHVVMPTWEPRPWLKSAAKHLESAQLLMAYRFNQEWGQKTKDALVAAYKNPLTLQMHIADLNQLHQYIRNQGGRVIFLTFPALNSEELTKESGLITSGIIRHFFANTCQPGDLFIDASSSLKQLPQNKRIVSLLDPHPSPVLHTLIADRIRKAIHQQPSEQSGTEAYESCEALRQALAHSWS
jgi:hypothetical protein